MHVSVVDKEPYQNVAEVIFSKYISDLKHKFKKAGFLRAFLHEILIYDIYLQIPSPSLSHQLCLSDSTSGWILNSK